MLGRQAGSVCLHLVSAATRDELVLALLIGAKPQVTSKLAQFGRGYLALNFALLC